jgi:hypothetical protein
MTTKDIDQCGWSFLVVINCLFSDDLFVLSLSVKWPAGQPVREYLNRHGNIIAEYSWLPSSGDPRAYLFISNGYCDHCGTVAHEAKFFSSKGMMMLYGRRKRSVEKERKEERTKRKKERRERRKKIPNILSSTQVLPFIVSISKALVSAAVIVATSPISTSRSATNFSTLFIAFIRKIPNGRRCHPLVLASP